MSSFVVKQELNTEGVAYVARAAAMPSRLGAWVCFVEGRDGVFFADTESHAYCAAMEHCETRGLGCPGLFAARTGQ